MFVCFLLYAISCNYGNNGGLRTTSRTVIASGQGHFNCVCAYGSVCMCVCGAAFNTAYTRWQCKLHACTPEGEEGGSQTLHTCSLTSDTHGTEVFALRIRTVATHCINCLNLPRNRMTHIHRTIQLNLSNSVWFNHISHFVAIYHDSYNPVLACAKKLLLLLLLLFIYFYSTGL